MLHRLSIKNHAIIDELEIQFDEKMNCITGETGAGKSIIVGALGLILGNRVDSATVINKEKKSIVEGVFRIENQKRVKEFLWQNDFDVEQELVLRREISVNGKSRAFINDTPVTVNQLQELSSLMVDLHQQFDGVQFGENQFQQEVLDVLAKNGELLNAYQELFRTHKKLQQELTELTVRKENFEKEAEYNNFQLDELTQLNLKEQELEQIESELSLLQNAEQVKSTLEKVYFEMNESDAPVVSQLKALANQLNVYSKVHAELPQLVERLYTTQIEVQDISNALQRLSNTIHYDYKKVEQLNQRMNIGFKLLKKHGVKTTEALLDIQKQLEEKLKSTLTINELMMVTEKEVARLQELASEKAAIISTNRKQQAKSLEILVNKLLLKVGMPNARIQIEIQPADALNYFGKDKIEFLFDANKSQQWQPIRRVASGGELNRLMLCIKSLVAEDIDLPTLIFDEIDTGISGETAKQVGIILKSLSVNRQVICITHQPQIAGKADAHYFVYKEKEIGGIKTNIKQLNSEERVQAIAVMISGEKPTAVSIENAKELLNSGTIKKKG